MWIMDILRRIFGRKKTSQEAEASGDELNGARATLAADELHALDVHLRSGSHRVRIAAAEKLAEAGEQGALMLMSALKDEDQATYETAAWGIEVPLIEQGKGGMGGERLRQFLKPATQYLIGIVRQAEILNGAAAYDSRVSNAIGVLGATGDPEALPALEELLAKVRAKIEKDGSVRERVETRERFKWISTEDSARHLERQIKRIRGGPGPEAGDASETGSPKG